MSYPKDIFTKSENEVAAARTDSGVYDFLPAPAAGAAVPNYVEHYQLDALAFDYFAPSTDPATVHEERRLHEEILSRLPETARTVLDVGCGRGWVADALFPRGKCVISFDLARPNVEEVARRHSGNNHLAVVGDVLDLPFRDHSMDAIISSEVMEHVADLPTYLVELIRVTKPGGRIIISTPYAEKIQYSLCIHCNRATPLHAHLHSFNERAIAELLAPFPGIRYRTHTFSNKALTLLRTYPLLRSLPFPLWRWVDGLANRVVRRPSRLIVEIFTNSAN
jgi:ubiquinone/menaquinone biosynthesis C-methylase UbiE